MAVDEIVRILQSQINAGCSVNNIEKKVFRNLESYFSDKKSLQNNIFSSSILSAYEYTLKYAKDQIFFKGLKDIIKCYSDAYIQNPSKVAHVMIEGHDQFMERENMMWTIRNGKVPKSNDMYEQVMSCFEYIGNILEISVKGIIFELYAMIRIISNKEMDYNKVCKDDFGIVINNILTKGYFDYILKTDPIDIKLSDWRNIAKHNSFKVVDEKIECTHGKKIQYNFTISYDDLIQYFYQITRASNILNIARCIFVYDNIQLFGEYMDIHRKHVKFRDNMLFNQITITLMAYGLQLKDIQRDKATIKMVIKDLINTGNENYEFLAQRQTFLCNVVKEKWCLLNAEKVYVEYFDMYDQIKDVLWLNPVQESKDV